MVSEYLDALSAPVANMLGISATELSQTLGLHGVATVFEVPAQFVFPALGQSIAYAATGLGLLIARVTVPALKGGRMGMDALDLSGHFLNRTVTMFLNPATAAAIAGDVANLRNGLTTNNIELIRAALVRNPTEVQAVINQLIAALQQIVALPAGAAGVRVAAPAIGGRAITGVTVAPASGGGMEGVVF